MPQSGCHGEQHFSNARQASRGSWRGWRPAAVSSRDDVGTAPRTCEKFSGSSVLVASQVPRRSFVVRVREFSRSSSSSIEGVGGQSRTTLRSCSRMWKHLAKARPAPVSKWDVNRRFFFRRKHLRAGTGSSIFTPGRARSGSATAAATTGLTDRAARKGRTVGGERTARRGWAAFPVTGASRPRRSGPRGG